MLQISITRMGDTLRSAREAKGMSQALLAEHIGVSTRTIIAIEKNQRNPTFEVLYQLVRTLDISADLIFYHDQSPLTAEQGQFIRDLSACDGKEQRVVFSTLRSLILALRQNES